MELSREFVERLSEIFFGESCFEDEGNHGGSDFHFSKHDGFSEMNKM